MPDYSATPTQINTITITRVKNGFYLNPGSVGQGGGYSFSDMEVYPNLTKLCRAIKDKFGDGRQSSRLQRIVSAAQQVTSARNMQDLASPLERLTLGGV